MTAAHQQINQTSLNTEWYTPPEIIEAARQALGAIDLDPASSEAANRIVKAQCYHKRPNRYRTEAEIGGLPVCYYEDGNGRGGLNISWHGRVWMNHPFGAGERACSETCTKRRCIKRGYHMAHDLPGNADWINHLIDGYRRGTVTAAVCITFASTSESWCRPLLDFPICFPTGRVQYIDPQTGEPAGAVTKGSMITYLGTDVARFLEAFRPLGPVLIPAAWR